MIPEVDRITALYERLSRDDNEQGDSNSIINQKKMLEDYCAERGFKRCQHYTDDGFSGGNFNRPSWKRMMEDAEAGRIGVIIAKDMSRIGRNYLEVGYYTQVKFRELGIRFIAIGNNVDSTVAGSDDFMPFVNIFNEMNLRDCSRKIKATLRSKGTSGRRLTANVIYGYKKDENDPEKWVIDEEAAAVVRRIFEMTLNGVGPYKIATILMDEQVERPSYYMWKRGLGSRQSNCDTAHPYAWHGTSVIQILEHPEYMGCTVNFRTTSLSYKTKKQKHNDPSEWVIFEDTQEPIVDKETWELAQKLRQTTRRTDTTGEANPLTGLVFCADCGAKMYNHRRIGAVLKSDPTKRGKPVDTYGCSTYFTALCRHIKSCSSHNIRTEVLREIVLETIKSATQDALRDEDAFRGKVIAAHELHSKQAVRDFEKKLEQDKARCKELDTLIQNLFEANVSGRLSNKRFAMLSETYEKEQAELERSIAEGEQRIAQFKVDSSSADRFLEIARRYTDFSQLTTPMLNSFVEKIVVYESEKIDGERTQMVDVYLRFIGKVELPQQVLTADEAAEEEKRKAQRAKNREKANRCYQKKKRKMAEEEAV